ncbi:MAG TPA: response regulator, partial [Acidimicrobiales bacterium]|nr:response regulator [Acidimicrobiales bacterium]
IRAGGLVMGAITFATDPERLPFGASDLAVAEEVAGRVCSAVERVLLYREVSEAAGVSAKTATQLRQLVEASLTLQQLRSGAEIASAAADAARTILGAELAVVRGRIGQNENLQAVARGSAAVVCRRLDNGENPEVPDGLLAPDGLPAGLDYDSRQGEGWFSVPLRTREGHARGVLAVAQRDDGGPDGHTVAALLGQLASEALDAMDQYRTAQLRQDRWRSLIEATPAAIVEIAPDGRVILWNRSAAAMFGWPHHDESREPTVGFPTDLAGPLSELWARTLAEAATVEAELAAHTAVGPGALRVSIAPLSSEGVVYGMLLLATDVTEQNRIRESMSRAEQVEVVGQVAGGVAHDFNNLLTVISGYTDLLSREPRLTEGEQELLSGIRTAADRAAVLTQQLLAISRRQVTNPVALAPNITMFGLSGVLDRLLGVNIRLRWNLEPGGGQICIDPARFEQLILNLAINGRDAMPDGGSFEISSEAIHLDEEQAEQAELAVPPGDYMRITVADTGSGMDEATRRRCFEPFFTTKDRAKGTGLGLAAVHSIVTESEGAIRVSSAPGEGTTFEMYFPRIDEEVAIEPPRAAEPRSRGSEIILVVEDQDEVRRLIRRVLERDGYLVLEAGNGPEALQIATQWEGPIELLITDVVLPGMRGPDVASAIKALRPRTKVMFTSAYSHGTVFPDGVVADAATLLPKPFKPSELVTQVRAILDQRRRPLVQSDSPPPGPS